jgi:hypothetical protein
MKKKYVLNALTFLVFLTLSAVYAQSNVITLKALPGGTEGNSFYSDSSILSVSAAGVVTYFNSTTTDDWSVTASTVTPSGALSKTFSVLMGGMSSVDQTEGNNYGKKIQDGGIDRASDGALGIRGGTGNGIDVNEGLNFGLNLTNLSSSAAIQITKIYVTLAGAANESGVVVSRLNPSKRITFGNSATTGVNYPISNSEVAIDISSFNVYLQGGTTNNDMIAVFNNSPVVNTIRITGLELKVLTNILNTTTVANATHPRLLLKAGEEALIQTLVNSSPEHKKSHDYIIETANAFLLSAPIVKPTGTRILSESHEAIEQIFFLSYAYRMTGQTNYLTKAETVINDVCNWDNWNTYSLDTSEMTFAVAIGYDWLYSGLSETTKQKAREKILNYGFLTQKNSAFWNYTSNWNQVCIGALACSALAIYGDGTTQMNTEAAFVLNNILVKNPNSMNTYGDGNYPEGPMYWSYGTTYEVLMLSALESVYGKNHEVINRLIASPGFLESAEYMQYVTGPTSQYYNYSDSTSKRIPLPATLWMAEKANKPSWLSEEKKLMQNGSYPSDFENRRFLPLALIYGKNISLDNLPEPQAKLWKGYGVQPVVLARTAWQGATGKYMGVKGGTPTHSHAQMDGGFFVYDSQGIRWGMDFGKYDYDAQGTVDDNDFSQTSQRWDIFRVSNLSQNTISIKKASESSWQHHKVDGAATIDEIYDSSAKRGAKVNMKSLLGLNNELLAANRSAYLVDESYLEIKDYLSNGAEPINLYWNMVTKSIVETVSPSKIRLTQGGKTVILEIVSSNPLVTFTLATNRSTDPVFYNPTATADSKNPGTVMIGFEASIPANNEVTFTVTIKDDAEVAPSSVEPINSIVLDLPNPTSGREGSTLFYDTSEFHIDVNGDATIGGEYEDYAWRVNGGTDIAIADNTKFFFRWKGMATTNTTAGVNYGSLLTQAGIDRASDGKIGIRGGVGAGIDPNEGFNLGFDLSFLPANLQLQIVKIGVSEVSGARMGEIVNRKDTTKKITFGGSSSIATVKFSSSAGDVNVESLNIKIIGGTIDYDLASLFSTGGTGGFRMTKFVFKIIDITPTSSTWNGTVWSNTTGPNSTIEAIIEGNYSTATNGSFNAKKLTINSGSLITNSNIEIQNEIINNAGVTGIVIQNNGSITQVNPLAVNTGNITVNKNSNLLKRLDYTLWSSPVVGTQTLANFSPLTSQSPNRFYIYDKTLGTAGLFASIAPTTTFSKGTGYLIRMPNENPAILGTSSAYYLGNSAIIYTGIFTGIPNNGTITLNSLTPNTFYAVGNPYPSTISADAFINGNATAGTLYFWRKTNAAAGTAYATYTLLGGAGTNTGNNGLGNPNGTIAIGQGFIVKTGLTATTLNFTNTMRTSGTGSTQFFKTKQLAVKDRVWLNLSNAGEVISQTLVGYMDGATQGVDTGIDGKYINDSAIALTSNINNEEYTIQGRPAFEATDVVALNFKTDVAGDYSIALDYFDGVFAARQAVYLADSKTGAETDLKAGAYNFMAEAGVDNSRFSLKYQKKLKVIDSEFNENSVTVYRNNGSLFVKSEVSTISNIKVFDIQGRLIAEQKKVNSNTASVYNLKTNQALIIQVSTDENKIVNKKVLN